ncbi:hypothetical protein ACHAW6_010164 [Cyclotella cf. meneghiniana]
MTMYQQQVHQLSTSPSFPRTHPRSAGHGHRSPLGEIDVKPHRSSNNAKAAMPARYEDPPLDLQLQLLTNLNASFGLIGGNDDDDDGYNQEAFDREFELIYEMDDDNHARYHIAQPNQHCQHKQYIHRTSHIPYEEHPDGHTTSTSSHGHHNQRQSVQTFQHGIVSADADDNTQLSSVDLNPYSGRTNHDFAQGAVHNNNSQSTKEQQINNRESIFRSLASSPSHSTPSKGHSNTPANKQDTLFNLPSPNTVMNRRVTKSSPNAINTTITHTSTTSPRSQVSPTHSEYNNSTTRPVGILRNPTVLSSFTQTTVTSPTSLSSSTIRSRSASRQRRGTRSRSRNGSRSIGRSTSRSKSRTRHNSSNRENFEYHESLFRGAQLIKEQLLRSMAGVDRERQEAEIMFQQADAMLAEARGGERDGAERAADMSDENQKIIRLEEDDIDNVDFDYSGGDTPPEQYLAKSPSRSSTVAVGNSTAAPGRHYPIMASPSMTHSSTTASSVSQRLESESRRLDNLVKIFAQTSSMTSATPSLIPSPSSGGNTHEMKHVPDEKSSSSDKENEEYPQDEIEDREDHTAKNINKVASPKSPFVETNNATAQNKNAFVTQTSTNDDSVGFGYAKLYLEDTAKSSGSSKNVTKEEFVSQSELQLQYQQKQQSQDPKTQHPAEEALTHARAAGPLWRSLVGNHVRFPYAWDSILPSSSPPIDRPNLKWSKWYYVARHRVRGDRKLNSREYGVRSRRSGGRILLNLVVRDMHTMNVCREIAVGCFHPNAKGIRKGDPSPEVEDVREIWMAVRWVVGLNCTEPDLGVHHYEEDIECFIDSFLTQKRQVLDYYTMGSPLGHRKAVSNENVRAVFGDQPPLQMVDLHEDELAEILKANDYKRLSGLPGLMLLKLFLFSK